MANAEARSLVERTLKDHGSAQAAIEEFERRDHERAEKGPKLAVPEVVPGAVQPGFSCAAYVAYAGPGLLVAAAYVDPGSIEAALASGTFFGTTLLWVHVWLLIPATLLHSMAVRVSVVTQRSLAQLLRDEYQDRPLIHYGLFGTAYVSLMAHLIPQVYGVAFALWELLAVPVPMGALLCGVWSLTLLHWRGRHDEARGLEALFGFAAVLVLACAAGQLFLAVPSWSNPFFELVELAEGLLIPLVPQAAALYLCVSLLGSAVLPHNLYLASHHAMARDVANNADACKQAVFYNTVDGGVALAGAAAVGIAFTVAGAAVGENRWQSTAAATALLEDPLYGTVRVLADRKWAGASAVTLFSVVALVGGLMAATAAAHAGQVVLRGFLLSDKRAAAPPWSYLGRAVPMAWAVALVMATGASHGRVLMVGCSVIVAVTVPFSLVPLVKLSCSRWVAGPLFGGDWLARLCWANVVMVVMADAMLLVFALSHAPILSASTLGATASEYFATVVVGAFLFLVVGLAAYPLRQNLVSSAPLHTVLGKFRLQNSLLAEEYRQQGGADEGMGEVMPSREYTGGGYGGLEHHYKQYDRPVRDVHSSSKALDFLGGRLPAPLARDPLGAAAESAARRPIGRGDPGLTGDRGERRERGTVAPRVDLQDRIAEAMRAF